MPFFRMDAVRRIGWTMGVLLQLSLPASYALGQAAMPSASRPDPAASQGGEELPPGYKAAAELGFKEFELKNYPEAYARFLKAEKLFPNARMARALGMVEYELRRYQQAIQHLNESLTRPVRPLSAEERDAVDTLLAQARAYLARYTISTRPEDAKLLLDGTPVMPGSDRSLVIQVGDHMLEARAKGYWPTRRELHVIGQSDQTIELHMLPVPRADAGESKPLYANPWVWTGAGVVAAGAAVLLVALLQPADRVTVGDPITTAQTRPGSVLQALGSH